MSNLVEKVQGLTKRSHKQHIPLTLVEQQNKQQQQQQKQQVSSCFVNLSASEEVRRQSHFNPVSLQSNTNAYTRIASGIRPGCVVQYQPQHPKKEEEQQNQQQQKQQRKYQRKRIKKRWGTWSDCGSCLNIYCDKFTRIFSTEPVAFKRHNSPLIALDSIYTHFDNDNKNRITLGRRIRSSSSSMNSSSSSLVGAVFLWYTLGVVSISTSKLLLSSGSNSTEDNDEGTLFTHGKIVITPLILTCQQFWIGTTILGYWMELSTSSQLQPFPAINSIDANTLGLQKKITKNQQPRFISFFGIFHRAIYALWYYLSASYYKYLTTATSKKQKWRKLRDVPINNNPKYGIVTKNGCNTLQTNHCEVYNDIDQDPEQQQQHKHYGSCNVDNHGSSLLNSPLLSPELIFAAFFFSMGFFLTNVAFQASSATFVETVKAAEPLTSAIVAVSYKLEHLSLQQAMSLLVIVAGVLLSTTSSSSPQPQSAPKLVMDLENNEKNTTRDLLVEAISYYTTTEQQEHALQVDLKYRFITILLDPSIIACAIVMSANLCFSFRGLYQKLFTKSLLTTSLYSGSTSTSTIWTAPKTLDDMNLQFRMQQIGAYMFTIPMLMMEFSNLVQWLWKAQTEAIMSELPSRVMVTGTAALPLLWNYFLLSLVNGLAFTMYNLASTFLLSRITVVHHAALNCIRRIFAIVVTSILFHVTITYQGWLGILTAFIGFMSFTYLKSIQEQQRQS